MAQSKGHFSAAPESAIPPCDIDFGLKVHVFDLFLRNVCLVCACHSAACICTQASSTPEGLYCFPHYLTGKSLYIGQQNPVAVPCSRRGNSTIGVLTWIATWLLLVQHRWRDASSQVPNTLSSSFFGGRVDSAGTLFSGPLISYSGNFLLADSCCPSPSHQVTDISAYLASSLAFW